MLKRSWVSNRRSLFLGISCSGFASMPRFLTGQFCREATPKNCPIATGGLCALRASCRTHDLMATLKGAVSPTHQIQQEMLADPHECSKVCCGGRGD